MYDEKVIQQQKEVLKPVIANELMTKIWEIQIKLWSVSLNLGLVSICSYSIRITIKTFTNMKQTLKKKSWENNELLKIWKNLFLTKSNQTKMLQIQKGYTSPILRKCTLLNLINEKYFHIFVITSHNKSTSIVLFLIT